MIDFVYKNDEEIRKIQKWYNDNISRTEFWLNIDELISEIKVSQTEPQVKPEIAETKARIEELERVLRLNVGKNYTVFLMIPRVDITGKIIKLKKQLAGQ